MPDELLTIKAVLAYQRTLTLRADMSAARDPFASPYRPTEAAAKRCFYDQYAVIRQRDDEQHRQAVAADPNAEPRSADEQRSEAAQNAMQILASRARASEREHQEHETLSRRSLERHQRRQREAARDREQRRNGMTIGQRLDQALADFSVIPAVDAAEIGFSTRSTEAGGVAYHGDPTGEARHLAIKVVREVEALLDRHQLRDVSKDRYAKKAA